MIADWDDAYDNAGHIPDSDGLSARWEARPRRSARASPTGFAPACPTACIRARGPTCSCPRRARGDRGLRARRLLAGFDRGDWSHFAAGALARGWAVAIPGYVLAPKARIAAITR